MKDKSLQDLLQESATALGIQITEEASSLLFSYMEELRLWSPKIDLIAQTDPIEILRKHILDSLAVVPLIPPRAQILDLGSGAGLPGIPMAIVLIQSPVALLEARRKRVSFLKAVARSLKLKNLIVYEGRAEILAQDQHLHKSFDVAITRATWNTEQFLQFAAPFLRSGGRAISMKGPKEENVIESGENSKERLGFCLKEYREYILPFGQEKRRLLTFVKSEQ
jgi:16S rRNA (guanine527-N7)-methyltransferase